MKQTTRETVENLVTTLAFVGILPGFLFFIAACEYLFGR